MSRAPFVMPKVESAFSRINAVYDTTIGWRFVNPRMKALHGIDSMPETAENVARDFAISREDQDRFAFRSQQKAAAAQAAGYFADEIDTVAITYRKGANRHVAADGPLLPDPANPNQGGPIGRDPGRDRMGTTVKVVGLT